MKTKMPLVFLSTALHRTSCIFDPGVYNRWLFSISYRDLSRSHLSHPRSLHRPFAEIPSPTVHVGAMSEPSDKLSAPRVPHPWHTPERDHFAGTFIGAILYGTPPYVPVCRCSHSDRFHYRDCRRSVFPAYGRAAQPGETHKGAR